MDSDQHAHHHALTEFHGVLSPAVSGPHCRQMHHCIHNDRKCRMLLFHKHIQHAYRQGDDGKCIQHEIFRSIKLLLVGNRIVHPASRSNPMYMAVLQEG